MIFDIIKDILDKKVPFKIYSDDTSYRKLNHILMRNAPRELIDQVLFDYEFTNMLDDYSIVHFYNKKHNIWIDLKIRYVHYIADPDKSHFVASGYKIYRNNNEES